MKIMGLAFLKKKFGSQNVHYLSLFAQQAGCLVQASEALCAMTETVEFSRWKTFEKEVKACEVQGDALLSEFHELLYGMILRRIRRSDLQTIAMHIDEFLDTINDSAKSFTLYSPKQVDQRLADLAQYISSQADAIRKMVASFDDFRKNYAKIAVQCERITELEHVADDTFAEYIGHIFSKETDPIELMKYKNIAETLESATDAAKRVSDSVRKVIMRYSD